MTDMYDSHNLEDVYGSLYQFSDHKRGDVINYFFTDLGEQRGTILWVAAPQKIAGTHVGAHYIVEPDRGGMPDTVEPSDIIINRDTRGLAQ